MSSTALRDAGLRRVSHLTRWAVGGAVVVAAVFSAAAARAVPGKAKASDTTPGAVSAPSSSAGDGGVAVSPADPSASQAGNGLVAPAQAPRGSRGSASVSSGAS